MCFESLFLDHKHLSLCPLDELALLLLWNGLLYFWFHNLASEKITDKRNSINITDLVKPIAL